MQKREISPPLCVTNTSRLEDVLLPVQEKKKSSQELESRK